MKRILIALSALLLIASYGAAVAADGMIQVKSPYSPDETVQRFVETAKSKGLKIFTTVDHAEGAAGVDLELRPTTVVIFGNPKAGTPFMQCAQTVGIDLPMKALIWQDADDQVWLGYNDPAYIAKRHEVEDCPAVTPIGKALSALAQATVAPETD
ncbi:DUF302 domain-containing protein [Salinisphaera aquimarina]|uniref:DUF302 domain-containing protein n=1 Tax=Salinisphaera aquimarina TaxID=2094031 RepID=A0ABV7ENY5_9GAMM